MTTRVQPPKEDVSVYFHEKVKLCHKLNLSFNEVKEQVVIGLYSKDLASMIMARFHQDMKTIYLKILFHMKE